MGEWNIRCAVSGLPIREGEECYVAYEDHKEVYIDMMFCLTRPIKKGVWTGYGKVVSEDGEKHPINMEAEDADSEPDFVIHSEIYKILVDWAHPEQPREKFLEGFNHSVELINRFREILDPVHDDISNTADFVMRKHGISVGEENILEIFDDENLMNEWIQTSIVLRSMYDANVVRNMYWRNFSSGCYGNAKNELMILISKKVTEILIKHFEE